jgi:hypothetical protein
MIATRSGRLEVSFCATNRSLRLQLHLHIMLPLRWCERLDMFSLMQQLGVIPSPATEG